MLGQGEPLNPYDWCPYEDGKEGDMGVMGGSGQKQRPE